MAKGRRFVQTSGREENARVNTQIAKMEGHSAIWIVWQKSVIATPKRLDQEIEDDQEGPENEKRCAVDVATTRDAAQGADHFRGDHLQP
jgi:hypothetical protein